MQQKSKHKYTSLYSEPLARAVSDRITFVAPVAAAVPIYADDLLLDRCIDSLEKAAANYYSTNSNTPLIILIVNGKTNDDEEKRNKNSRAINTILSKGAWKTLHEQAYLTEKPSCKILLVDCASEASFMFPETEGVGLARKIGADIACNLYVSNKLLSPYIRNTDVDVTVPEDYFFEHSGGNAAAYVESFCHVTDQPDQLSWTSLQVYECWLRYYVLGLKFAKSPYGFQTLGSTITVHADAYANVRGFPKRLAGEDFYILSKLAKTGSIVASKKMPLKIHDRPSDRVPFGTGAAVAKIQTLLSENNDYRFYHPKCFEVLKSFLAYVPRFYDCNSLDVDDHVELANTLEFDKVGLSAFFAAINLKAGIESAKRVSTNPHIFLNHFHSWFDALKTLRTIHYLRDQHFGTLELANAISTAPFAQAVNKDLSLTCVLKQLRELDAL